MGGGAIFGIVVAALATILVVSGYITYSLKRKKSSMYLTKLHYNS